MKRLLLFCVSLLLTFGCETSDIDNKDINTEPTVLSLTFFSADNPLLTDDVNGVINEADKTIEVVINYPITTQTLIPKVELSQGASSNIEELTPMDVKKDNILKVIGGGTENAYHIIFHINEPTSIIAIKVNGAECYNDTNTNTYYAPLSRELWGKAVSIEVLGTGINKSTIGTSSTEYGKPIEIGLSMNKKYEISVEGTTTIKTNIIITGLPIIIVTSSSAMDNLTNTDKTPCKISLFDPTDGGSRNHHNLNGKLRVRGNSSSYYKKKSLALELYDEAGVILDKSFLGMRKDDDWILDAMFMEQLRMRNRISQDIWLDMYKLHYATKEPKAVATNRGEMAEMFYNGEYMGIYCISEKVDRKQQNLNDISGALYKGEDWTDECIFKSIQSYNDPSAEFFGGWQIQHPTEPYNWKPFLDFLTFVTESDYKNGASSTFGKGIEKRVVIDNLVDFLLHLNIVNGTDNTGRNTFLSVYDTNSKDGEEAKFFYTPWDLDATFGTDWLYKEVSSDLFLGLKDVYVPSEKTYANYMLMKIAKYDIADFGTKIKSRWTELRTDKASDKNIIKRFDYYYDILNTSGAYAREKKRWGNYYEEVFGVSYDPQREIEYVKVWIPRHLSYIDSYIKNWDANASKIVIR
ncbi:MAG: CotH kinase family protein [Rikenellaceae bacterium]